MALFSPKGREDSVNICLPDEWFGCEGPSARQKFVVVIDNVFTPQECQSLIAASEAGTGYSQALINTGTRQILATDTRSSDRWIVDSPEFAAEFWKRIMGVMSQDERLTCATFNGGKRRGFRAVGLNERMRFLRYDSGGFFAPHFDGAYVRGKEAGKRRNERSFVTCQLYLNDGEIDFQGGTTRFLSLMGEEYIDCVPRPGRVLLFQHDLLHAGSLVTEGRKYCVRTDVMYSNAIGARDYLRDPLVLEKEGQEAEEGHALLKALANSKRALGSASASLDEFLSDEFF